MDAIRWNIITRYFGTKPENFDSAKRYPIIFSFYEQLSHKLHEFHRPEFSNATIDITWFVSRGYLVLHRTFIICGPAQQKRI